MLSGNIYGGGVPVVVAAEHDCRLQRQLHEHAQPAHGRDRCEQQPRCDELAEEHDRRGEAQQEGRERVVQPRLGRREASAGKVILERRQRLPRRTVCGHLDSARADHELDPLRTKHPRHRVGGGRAVSRRAEREAGRVEDRGEARLEKQEVPLEGEPLLADGVEGEVGEPHDEEARGVVQPARRQRSEERAQGSKALESDVHQLFIIHEPQQARVAAEALPHGRAAPRASLSDPHPEVGRRQEAVAAEEAWVLKPAGNEGGAVDGAERGEEEGAWRGGGKQHHQVQQAQQQAQQQQAQQMLPGAALLEVGACCWR